MSSGKVIVETKDRIRIVTINRPEARNAVDQQTATMLFDAFVDFDADDTVDVAILTGASGHFCAGADLKTIAQESTDRVQTEGPGPMGPTRLQPAKPVIAAIEGYAVAGGLELALWCDLRVMAEDATFGVFCRRFGVPLVDGGTVRLPRLIGHSRAMDLVLTGRPVDAEEALQMGLANRVTRSGLALDAALELARELTALPQTCLRNDRRSLLDQWGASEDDALRWETELGLATIASGETEAGAGRFSSGEGRHGQPSSGTNLDS